MNIRNKIDGEIIDINADIPESNSLVSSALMVPIIQEKNAKRFEGYYKMPSNVNNPSFEGFYKRLVFEKATTKLDISHHSLMDEVKYLDKLYNDVIYYDGTYVNDVIDFKKYSFVFSIAFSKDHKKWIEKNAERDGVNINKIYFVGYKRYVDVRDKYVQGSKWIAANIGGSIGKTVFIPNTPDFWSTERYRHLYSEGSKWISRFYGRIVTIVNPVSSEENKKTILKNLSKDRKIENYIYCTCGKCMECLTNYIVISDKLPEDFFEEDPRLYEEGLRMIRTAYSLNKIGADLYIDST